MAYIGVTASSTGLCMAGGSKDLNNSLERLLRALPASSRVLILIHGYRYHPDSFDRNPHHWLYSRREDLGCQRARSWPLGLGYETDESQDGLCIGFGWPALEPHLPAMRQTGKTGFSLVYGQALNAGAQLAELMKHIQVSRPDLSIDILAHSLGARVALSALPSLKRVSGRLILLGAAEYQSNARGFLAASPQDGALEVYNITARFNDLYDAFFAALAPRPRRRERTLGLGLGTDHANWIDLQLDRDEFARWLGDRGIALEPIRARFCHWGFYTQAGVFALYRSILARDPGWDVATLKSIPGLSDQDPQWSRLAGWSTRAILRRACRRPGGPNLKSA
ncbi:MAG: alpha/beta hydrolase [Pseudomonadota bacterium]